MFASLSLSFTLIHFCFSSLWFDVKSLIYFDQLQQKKGTETSTKPIVLWRRESVRRVFIFKHSGDCVTVVMQSFIYDPLVTISQRGNISLRFSSNYEAFASELLEILKKCTQSNLQWNNSMLLFVEVFSSEMFDI